MSTAGTFLNTWEQVDFQTAPSLTNGTEHHRPQRTHTHHIRQRSDLSYGIGYLLGLGPFLVPQFIPPQAQNGPPAIKQARPKPDERGQSAAPCSG